MKKFLVGIIIFLFPLGLIGVQKGSNSVVSVESSAIFPAEDNDNAMLTFGYFKNGFTLEDNTTTCTFDSVFSVGGVVTMNGGQVFCTDDLKFDNSTYFVNGGIFNVNGFTLDFAPGVVGSRDFYPSTIVNAKMELHTDFYITGSVFVQGNCIVEGRNHHVVMWGSEACVVIMPGSTLTINNASIEGLQGTNIQCSDDTASIICSNCSLLLSDDYIFTNGSFEFNKKVIISGGKKLVYQSSAPSIIDTVSTLYLDSGSELTYEPPVDQSNLIHFADQTSTLYLNGATLSSTTTGMQLTTGSLVFSGNSALKSKFEYDSVNATAYTTGFIIGDGVSSSNDFSIHIMAGSQLNVNSAWLTYQNVLQQSFVADADTSILQINQGSALYIDTTLDMGIGALKADATSSIIRGDNGILVGNVLIMS